MDPPRPEARFNINLSYQYNKSCYGDKMVFGSYHTLIFTMGCLVLVRWHFFNPTLNDMTTVKQRRTSLCILMGYMFIANCCMIIDTVLQMQMIYILWILVILHCIAIWLFFIILKLWEAEINQNTSPNFHIAFINLILFETEQITIAENISPLLYLLWYLFKCVNE